MNFFKWRRKSKIRSYLRRIPKAEIHLHFEGAIGAKTLLYLGKKYEIHTLRTLRQAEGILRFQSPQQFFGLFLYISSLMQEPEDFTIAARYLGDYFAQENIRYAELTLAPHKFIRQGIAYPQLLHAIDRGLRESQSGNTLQYRYIIDIVRDLGPAVGLEMMREVEKHPHPLVAGIGLGGSETFPAQTSLPVYEYAERLGLRKTAHAGEGCGPESIWNALNALQVERIDHGVRAEEEPSLVQYLCDHKIPLNLCPTSNVQLGVVPALENHPLLRYFKKGIPVTVSTDDPALFKITLTQELENLVEKLNFPLRQIPQLMENAIRAAFLPNTDKEQLQRSFADEFQQIPMPVIGRLAD